MKKIFLALFVASSFLTSFAQIELPKGTASGTNTYSVTIEAASATLKDGIQIIVKFANANTGASTLRLNTLATKSISLNGAAIVSGDVPANVYILFTYNSSSASWQMSKPGASGGAPINLTAVSPLSITSNTISITSPLPIVNGGTNTSIALSGSSIMISDGSKIVQGAAGTTTSVLHGNAGGAPTYSAVSLTADVSGKLPTSKGGTNTNIGDAAVVVGDLLVGDGSNSFQLLQAGAAGKVLTANGLSVTPTWQTPTSGWALAGNALTGTEHSPTEFFGSTNNFDVVFKENNSEIFRLYDGNVGIGTSSPPAKLSVTSSGTSSSVRTAIFNSGLANPLMALVEDGTVGIGIQNPTEQLHQVFDVAGLKGMKIENNNNTAGLTGAALYLEGNSTNIYSILFHGATAFSGTQGRPSALSYYSKEHSFVVNSGANANQTMLFINADGKIGSGVNVTSPSAQMDIRVGTSAGGTDILNLVNGASTNCLGVRDDGLVSMISGVGVRIGTTAAITGYPLTIKQTLAGNIIGADIQATGTFDAGGESTTGANIVARGNAHILTTGISVLTATQGATAGNNLVGALIDWNLAVGASGAPGTVHGIKIRNPSVTTGAKPTTSTTGIEIQNQGLSTIPVTYGIDLLQQSGSTSNINLRIGAGTTTTLPIQLTSGSLLTTALAGGIEFLTDDYYATITTGAARQKICRVLTGSATLNFANQAAIGCNDLTVTVTGAADGDDVSVSPPNGSVPTATSFFTAWVSAANTVTVRYCALVSGDPASGTFKVTVIKN